MGFLGDIVGGIGDIFGGSEQSAAAPAQSSSTTTPWSEQIPYLQQIFGEAQSQYNKGLPEFYTGQGVAGFNPYQTEAFGMAADRARTGSPTLDMANQLSQDTMGGQYLNSNPYLDQMISSSQDEAQKRLASTFGTSGRYGSGLHQAELGKNFMNIGAGIRGNNYEAERGRQMQAAGFAPTLAGMDYADSNALAKIGAIQQGQDQSVMDYDRAKYDYNANREQNALMNYLNLIQGNYGGSTTGTATPYQGQVMGQGFNLPGAIGGGMTGYGQGGGIGATIGGILGGFF